MKKIWVLLSRLFGYNQVTENEVKGYITFQKISALTKKEE